MAHVQPDRRRRLHVTTRNYQHSFQLVLVELDRQRVSVKPGRVETRKHHGARRFLIVPILKARVVTGAIGQLD
jgi:hypothetical protein